jgi:lysine-N-methylase
MGECPDTCCRDWEIVLDEDARRFYETVPGELGEQLRAAMEAGGGEYLALDHALCPFLNDAGLCRIQLAYGEEHLTRNCATYPRFAEEYGALREWALAISCPEAARMILTVPDPTAFDLVTTDEPLTETNDLDASLFFCLTAARKKFYALATERTLPFADRLALCAVLADRVQNHISREQYGAAQETLASFDPTQEAAHLNRTRVGAERSLAVLLDTLRGMEILTPRYRALLDAAQPTDACAMDDPAWENLLVYFLYRYVLKAAVDGKLFSRVRAAVCGCLALRMLMGQGEASREKMIDLAHLYGREIEHNSENMANLLCIPLNRKQLLRAVLC